MSLYERYYPQSVHGVWNVFANPDAAHSWTFHVPGYRAVVGNKFRITYLPILGTRFNGQFDCEVTAIIPDKLWAGSWHAVAAYGRAARWTQRIEFIAQDGGTVLRWSLAGVQARDPHEHVLHHVYTAHAHKTLTDLSNYLDSRHDHNFRANQLVLKHGQG